jgi:nucleoside-diphosphate-sugar epimerase
MSNVLIAGCGYVGIALASLLSSDKHTVWGLRRKIDLLKGSITPISADLTNPQSLSQIPQGLDFVFYTAAADTQSDAAYRMAYIVGLSCLIQTLKFQDQCPKRIFFTSSTAVYSQTKGEWVDEGSPTNPNHFAGVRLLEAESLVKGSVFPSTVVRFGGIYGPGRTRLITQARERGIQVSESNQCYTNRIHRDDCAGVLKHLMRLAEPDSLYLAVDGEPALDSDVARWLAGRLGIPVSSGVAAARVIRQGRSNKRCCNQKLLSSGYCFKYPTYREGYLELMGGEGA